jgi:glycosyltransferase involved in cell wall biosynthesis
MKKELLIYLAPWDHFKSESGFNVVAKRIKLSLEHSHSILFVSDSLITIWNKVSFKIYISLSYFIPESLKWTPFNQEINMFRSISFFLRVLFKNTTIILLAPEDQYCGKFLSKLKLRKNTVLFIHQPPSWFIKEKIDISSLKDVRQIIVLSASQKKYFEEKLSRKVILIKHGVDLSTFTITKAPKINSVLIVGQHLRDFEAIVNTVKKVSLLRSDIEFHFVIPIKYRPEILKEIFDRAKIYFHDNIPTTELVNLYNQAKVTFLPLKDSTANNTINESFACGTPILTNNVGGLTHYFTDECGIICSGSDPKEYCQAIIRIMDDEICFSSEDIRKFAENHFDWRTIINSNLVSKIIN